MIEGYTQLDNYRYERKFTLSEQFKGEVDVIIRQNPTIFRKSYESRQVNNIYFDTPGLDCFFDNLFGVGKRWKARIRWYGKLNQHVRKPILELKIKKGHLGTKKSWPLLELELTNTNFNSRMLNTVIRESEIPDDIKNRLLCMQPVLINNYKRQYYVSADNNFRLTVDTELEYRDSKHYINGSLQQYKERGKIVLELKYDKEKDEQARTISNLFPFRLNKNSKFVTGMNFIRPGVAE